MHRRVLASLGAATTMTLVAMASLPVSGQSSAAPPLVDHGVQRRSCEPPTPSPRRRGAIRICRASGAATMPRCRCRGRRTSATGFYLNDEEFAARAEADQDRHQQRARTPSARSAATSPAGPSARPRSSSIRRTAGRRRSRPKRRSGAHRAIRARSATARSTRPKTSRSTTAASRAASSARSMRVIYGNGNRIVQAPGMVAISYEMIHDTRVFYTDGRPHIGQGIRQYLGDSRGAMGRRRARRRDDEPDGQDQHRTERQRTAPQRQDEDHRALQARGGRHPAVPDHGGRSGDLRASVHVVAAADAARWRRRCCPTSATRGTTRSGSRSAPSARKTTRLRPISSAASCDRAGRCRMVWVLADSRSASPDREDLFPPPVAARARETNSTPNFQLPTSQIPRASSYFVALGVGSWELIEISSS